MRNERFVASGAKLAHAIGTFSRRQKIDAHGVAFANAAPQKIGTAVRVMPRARTHLTR
jgi:hypothetical protein